MTAYLIGFNSDLGVQTYFAKAIMSLAQLQERNAFLHLMGLHHYWTHNP